MADINPSGTAKVPANAQRALRTYLWVFSLLSLASWFPEIAGRSGFSWVNADYSALLHPSDTFGPSSAFDDLTDFTQSMQHLSGTTLAGVRGPFPYPPAAAYAFAFFLRLFAQPVGAYLVFFGLSITLASWLLWRQIGPHPSGLAACVVGLTLLAGSPQIFTANRGNLEWVNCAFTAIALVLFAKRRYLLAALLFGLAVSIKPFPVIFFTLFLWPKRYTEAAAGLSLTFLISLGALSALGPTIPAAIQGIGLGWADYFSHYVLVVRLAQEFRFNHSILDAIKVPVWFLFDHQQYDPRQLTAGTSGIPVWVRMDLWARAIIVFSVVSVGWITWYFRRMPILNGIFALSIAEMLLPYSAAEYTLLLLYVPWGLLLIASTGNAETSPAKLSEAELKRLLLPCAALFTPLSFMNCLTGLTKTLLLLYLFKQVCLIPLPTGIFGEQRPTTCTKYPRTVF